MRKIIAFLVYLTLWCLSVWGVTALQIKSTNYVMMFGAIAGTIAWAVSQSIRNSKSRRVNKCPDFPNDRYSSQDTPEARLKKTLFIVEATSAEQFMLWKDYSIESDSARYRPRKWEQVSPGWSVNVGELEGRPCYLSLSWCRIEGQLIMFWYQCSQVTDSVQAEAWLEKRFKGRWDKGTRYASGDVSNFHHCLDAIEEANEKTDK